MNKMLKKLIPDILKKAYASRMKWRKLMPLYLYNAKRFHLYGEINDSEESLIGKLTMLSHTIEKGFTMPDFRNGFGYDRIMSLIDGCNMYINRYGKENVQIFHIANVINDYKKYHEKVGFELDVPLQNKINDLLNNFDLIESESIQIDCTKNDYFSYAKSGFAEFSYSRHSCRNFTSEPVDVELINKAVKLAQNAPSACNRQAARVYVIKDKEKIQEVFGLHGGNRGFGHKVDKLIMVCGFIGCYGLYEKDCVYVDCGIFTMNLAYSLHYYGIGNCILNWSVSNDKDIKCRELLPIRDEDVICTLIACGNVPEKFKVCRSAKKELNRIIRYI